MSSGVGSWKRLQVRSRPQHWEQRMLVAGHRADTSPPAILVTLGNNFGHKQAIVNTSQAPAVRHLLAPIITCPLRSRSVPA